jgi:uncharacterized membrane protein YvbJ
MQETTPPKRQRKINKKLILAIPVIIALIAIIIIQQLKLQQSTTPNLDQQAITTQLKEKVSRHMIVPDETPSIATIENIDQLSSQDFFNNAQNGDKVLIFTAAKRAIIYRESEDKIINSGPIVLNSNATQ